MTRLIPMDELVRIVTGGRSSTTRHLPNWGHGRWYARRRLRSHNVGVRPMPVFELPKVRNARQGFFEDGDIAALLLELPADLRPVVQFLHITGWRKSEALNLTWEQVDWEGRAVRVWNTKSGEPRVFPFGLAPELTGLLEARWAVRDELFVFHRNGSQVRDFRTAWENACRRAGLVGKLVHDLRRSAARAYRRAGLAESDIMELCGWETREMFRRYCIKDEQALAAAVGKRFGRDAAEKPAVEPSGVELS